MQASLTFLLSGILPGNLNLIKLIYTEVNIDVEGTDLETRAKEGRD